MSHTVKVLKKEGFKAEHLTDNKGEKFVGWSKPKSAKSVGRKKEMAKKMKSHE